MKNRLIDIKNISLIILGTLVLSFGTAVFILPFDLITGGVASIAIILERIISSSAVSEQLLITLLTWLLFFAGLAFLGKDFALKTLISTVIYPLGVACFSRLVSPQVFDGLFCLDDSAHPQLALLMAAIFGGVFSGAGCALSFLGGGSTGGVDILAFLICKLSRRLKSSAVIFAIDAVTISCGLAVVGDLLTTLLGICSAFVTAMVIDRLFLGESKAFIAHIVTDKYEEMTRLVVERMDRTTSIIDIEGGYSRSAKKMIMISFSMNQYNELINIINTLDKTAFVTVNRAHEINGEGWTWQPKDKQ